ncbi:MAG: IS200/IS605 family transposase [Thermomicrobiales bacterium]
MPYTRLLYHVVWATKHRLPSIDESREAIIRASIMATSQELHLAVYGVGVMPDHVHVFMQIAPTLAVSRVIGRLKGASSHAVNAMSPDAPEVFAWQEGYGAISIS